MPLQNKFLFLLTEKERQEQRNISLNEVSRSTGVAVSVLARWFKNDISRFDGHVIEALCEYFDCDLPDLLYIDRGHTTEHTEG